MLVVLTDGPSLRPRASEKMGKVEFKGRDLVLLEDDVLAGQMKADASEGPRDYGGTVNIRRRVLCLFDKQVPVQRVRLIYESGALKPEDVNTLNAAVRKAQGKVK